MKDTKNRKPSRDGLPARAAMFNTLVPMLQGCKDMFYALDEHARFVY